MRLTDLLGFCFNCFTYQNHTSGNFHDIAGDPCVQQPLLDSTRLDIRTLGQKIKHVYQAAKRGSAGTNKPDNGPGGRHDNDFANISEISILPTLDKITSLEAPFLRHATELEDVSDGALHPMMYLDNHFRLLRENMIRELKEDFKSSPKPRRATARR